nr:reverse transcriptase domain-containing protein [Tanacetum cinerariifolium]
MLNITFGMTLICFEFVRIKSFTGVCMAKKLLISSKLVKKDPPRAIMVPISSLRKYLMPVSFGLPQRDEMPQNAIQVCDIFDVWVGRSEGAPTNDARVVVKFLKSLFARFGTPRNIISDRGTYFCNDQFARVMIKYGVTHHLATTYHPQMIGQVEVSNRGLKCILERTVGENRASPFLRTERALIDVYGEELALRVDDEAITFKVGQTLKYSYNDAELINRVDVIDVACEDYVQEVLGFYDNYKSGNPTPISNPIISLSSPSLTLFEGGNFILEEIEACLTCESIPPRIDDTDLDLEGDILHLEELLNNDHHYLLSLRKNLMLKKLNRQIFY